MASAPIKSDTKPGSMIAAKLIVGLLLCIVIGALFGILVFGCVSAYLGAATGGLLWGLALFGGGLLVGFIFAVPKSAAVDPKATGLRANTNLEDISDWLSKIIVGTGLIELKSLPNYLQRLAALIAGTIAPDGKSSPVAMSFGGASAVLFPSFGFLVGYLVTRIWIQPMFKAADDELRDKINQMETKVEQMQSRVDSNQEVAELAKQALNIPAIKPETKTIATTPTESIWDTDPHHGQFGGSPSANGRELSASITSVLSGQTTCHVHLEVKSADAEKPLTGTVTFYLHPTYPRDEIAKPVDADGVARLDILADSPFTVGVMADEGKTRLEIDLQNVPGGTKEFYLN